MKLFLLSLLLFSVNVFAQTLEIEIRGVRHSCTPIGNGSGAVSCVDLAYRGPFSKEEAFRLCQGAYNEMPARCATRAYNGSFSKEEALQMCTRAVSEGVVDCAEAAYRGPFSKEESLRLCSHPRASLQTAQCALEAYRGPYSKEEAISLCQIPRRRDHFKGTSFTASKDQLDELIKEANLKAFRLNEYK